MKAKKKKTPFTCTTSAAVIAWMVANPGKLIVSNHAYNYCFDLVKGLMTGRGGEITDKCKGNHSDLSQDQLFQEVIPPKPLTKAEQAKKDYEMLLSKFGCYQGAIKELIEKYIVTKKLPA